MSPSEKFAADGLQWTLGEFSFPVDAGDQVSTGSGGFDKQITDEEIAKIFGTPSPPPQELSPTEKLAEQKDMDWERTPSPFQRELSPSEKFAEQKVVGWERSWTPVSSPPYSPFASAQVRFPTSPFHNAASTTPVGSPRNSLFSCTSPSISSRRSPPRSPLGGS